MALVPQLQLVVVAENKLSLDWGEAQSWRRLASFSSFAQVPAYIRKFHASSREIPVRCNGHVAVMDWLATPQTLYGVTFRMAEMPTEDEPEGMFTDMPEVDDLVGESPLS